MAAPLQEVVEDSDRNFTFTALARWTSFAFVCFIFLSCSERLQLRHVHSIHRDHDCRNRLPAEEDRRQQLVRLGQDGHRIHPELQLAGVLLEPAGEEEPHRSHCDINKTLRCSVTGKYSATGGWCDEAEVPNTTLELVVFLSQHAGVVLLVPVIILLKFSGSVFPLSLCSSSVTRSFCW